MTLKKKALHKQYSMLLVQSAVTNYHRIKRSVSNACEVSSGGATWNAGLNRGTWSMSYSGYHSSTCNALDKFLEYPKSTIGLRGDQSSENESVVCWTNSVSIKQDKAKIEHCCVERPGYVDGMADRQRPSCILFSTFQLCTLNTTKMVMGSWRWINCTRPARLNQCLFPQSLLTHNCSPVILPTACCFWNSRPSRTEYSCVKFI